MTFSQRLSQARKARGMNQETLAHQVGVSRQAVSKWETGDALPDLPRLLALADALELPLDDLCGRELPPSPSQPPAPISTPTPESIFLPDSSQSAPPPCPDSGTASIPAQLRLRRILPLAVAFFLGAVLTLGALWSLRQFQLSPLRRRPPRTCRRHSPSPGCLFPVRAALFPIPLLPVWPRRESPIKFLSQIPRETRKPLIRHWMAACAAARRR